jgi:hypothetical protein
MDGASAAGLPTSITVLSSSCKLRTRRQPALCQCRDGEILDDKIRIERFGWTFCPGDKVMQVENDYDKDVYNGDLGVVSHIDMEEGEARCRFRCSRSHLRLC